MSNEVENTGKILIYQNEKGDTRIDVYFESDTIWMTQKAMCELYQVAKSSVSEHISNIFKDGELEPEATVRKFRTVQIEGTRQVTRERDYYNLDMILAVGYRVRSNVGIHFRRWASGVLLRRYSPSRSTTTAKARLPRTSSSRFRTSWNMPPQVTPRQSSLPIGPMLSRITWDSLLLRESKCAGAM